VGEDHGDVLRPAPLNDLSYAFIARNDGIRFVNVEVNWHFVGRFATRPLFGGGSNQGDKETGEEL